MGREGDRPPVGDSAQEITRPTKSGRGERIRTSGLYVPNVALYQAKLHPDCRDQRRRTGLSKDTLVATLQQLSRQLYQTRGVLIARQLLRVIDGPLGLGGGGR